MQDIIDVNTGDVVVVRCASILRAVAIGSCIAVTVYDSTTKNAGMAHIMLPGKSALNSTHKTRYAADAIKHLFDLLADSGSGPNTVDICLVGAGNVLHKADDTICECNIASVTSILAKRGVLVRASLLGGYERKSVSLEVKTGRVTYTVGDSLSKTLWTSAPTKRPLFAIPKGQYHENW